MRGTGSSSRSRLRLIRFIPAHAGNGICGAVFRADGSVHPRACGERMFQSYTDIPSSGSSPRMRGTGRSRHSVCTWLRFIPAHAGNGRWARCWRRSAAVHPRACGERPRGHRCGPFRNGSSPRMRGTVVPATPPRARTRFIPAHAGNGPRQELKYVGPEGSSPRMRGTGVELRCRSVRSRFIPAHAGNGRGRRKGVAGIAVHPRACGERALRQPRGFV